MRLRLFHIPKAFRALALTMLALATVLLMQIALSGGAFADEGHHHHAGASPAIGHNIGLVAHAPETGASAIPLDATPDDCSGNHHKTGSSQKSCCASTCCAAALAWEPEHIVRPAGRMLSIWAFTAQFVVLKHATGLDRPPDFRA